MMTTTCEKRIAMLHPKLQELARKHYEAAVLAGLHFRIAQAFRSPAEQLDLWVKGRDLTGNVVRPSEVVTNSPPGRSWHEYGLAYDVVLVAPNGEVSWDTAMDGDLDGIRDWQECGVAGEKVGLEWGGRWKRFRDMPHFQFTRGLSYEAAATLTANGKKIPEDYFA